MALTRGGQLCWHEALAHQGHRGSARPEVLPGERPAPHFFELTLEHASPACEAVETLYYCLSHLHSIPSLCRLWAPREAGGPSQIVGLVQRGGPQLSLQVGAWNLRFPWSSPVMLWSGPA